MYCPNCRKEYDGNFCPECGMRLIEKPISQGRSVNVNLGDANAISGGLHISDSHDVSNIDNSVHNISNTTSTVNNYTQVAAQKTEMELLQERKKLYLHACKRAYEDNVLEPSEKIELDRYRLELGLDEMTADTILDQVRQLAMQKSQRTELTGIAKIKLKQLTEALKDNDVKAILSQIDSFEALAGKFNNDELQYKYYLVLAALHHEICIEKYENTKVDNYWKSFWSYFAYLKENKAEKASEILFSLGDKYPNYPEDNAALLGAAGSFIKYGKEAAHEYLSSIEGNYTPVLQRLFETLYLIIDPDVAKELGATEEACAFYLIHFFKKNTGDYLDSKDEQKEVSLKSDSETETDVLKRQWIAMTAEAYKLALEAESSEDSINVLNMSIPPAMGGIPMAMLLSATAFRSIEQDDEANKWAKELMSLDPQNEDDDVMIAKAGIYKIGISSYTKNTDLAIAYYKASADKGNLDALCLVADMYYDGELVEQNFQMSLTWAKTAYESKNAYGIFIYGRAYFEGKGLPKDELTGIRLLNEATNMKSNSYLGAICAELYLKKI